MTPKSSKEILIEARALIDQYGWIQRKMVLFENGVTVGYCIVGAIDAVSAHFPAIVVAQSLLRPWVGNSIIEWNDQSGRTKEEVLALFDQAIEAAHNE